MLAVWAEMNLVVADEFRDGNVPAAYQGLAVAKAAFLALPGTVKERYFRGDSACHEHELMDWLRDENREDGPAGYIGFAVSARMSPALRAAIEAVPEAQWEDYGKRIRKSCGNARMWCSCPTNIVSGRICSRCA